MEEYYFTSSYEPPKAQVVRRFQNLGVQRANPAEYVARYGTQLADSQSLITEARKAGVVEDIVRSLFAFKISIAHLHSLLSFSHLLELLVRSALNLPVTEVINQVISVLVLPSLRQLTNIMLALDIQLLILPIMELLVETSPHLQVVLTMVLLLMLAQEVYHRAAMNLHLFPMGPAAVP